MESDFLNFLRIYQQQQAGALSGLPVYNMTPSDEIFNDTAAEVYNPLDFIQHSRNGNHSGLDDDVFSSSGSFDPADAYNDPSDSLKHFDFLPEELPDNVLSIFTVLYVVVIILGLGGNAMTTLVVAVNREMRTVTNVFLVSLAVSDALIAGVNMPVQLKFYSQNEWTLGEVACKLTSYTQGVVIVASILTLTSLALDRYYAICHPLRARHVHTTKRAVLLIVVIWIASLILVSPQLFIQRLEPMIALQMDHDPPVRIAMVCAEYFSDRRIAIVYTTFYYVVLYLFPVVTMFVTYGTIASKLWRRRAIGETPRADSQRETERRLREKKRIVCMLVLIVALFTISWFPFFSIQLYLVVEPEVHRNNVVRMTVAVLQLVGYSNCCVNPIVYCFLNESFQKNLLRTLRCRCLTRLVVTVKSRLAPAHHSPHHRIGRPNGTQDGPVAAAAGGVRDAGRAGDPQQSSGSNDQLMVVTNAQAAPGDGSRSVIDDVDMVAAADNVSVTGSGRRRRSSSCCNSETLMTSMQPASVEVTGQLHHHCLSELKSMHNDVMKRSQMIDYCQQCRCCTAV